MKLTSDDLYIQAKDPSRMTLVDCDRSADKAICLTTKPGDTDVEGSGAMERCDGYNVHRGTADPVAYVGCKLRIRHSVMLPSGKFRMPIGEAYNLADLHGWRPAHAANLAVNFVNWNSKMTDKLGWLQIQRSIGDPMSPTERSVAVCKPEFDVWYDFEHKIYLTSGEDGFCNSYMNGRPIMYHKGPTVYPADFVYFKIANYHAVRTDVPNVESSVIHDRISIEVM